MKPKSTLRSFLALAGSSLLAMSSANAQSTYIWDNSNITATPTASLNWFNATQGTWTGGTPVSSNLNTIQFFQDTTTALLNTGASGDTQASVIDTPLDAAFELATLTLNGLASATTSANLTMTISGDPLNFSAATGTINLNALNATRTITYNLNSNIQLGTASSVGALTIKGSGTGTFNIGGIISELQAGGGSLTKSDNSTVSLNNGNTYTGVTSVGRGVLLLNHATALPGGIGLTTTGTSSHLNMTGAGAGDINVLGLGNGDFLRPLGSSSVAHAVTFVTDGGWAAYGADRTVNLGGASAQITWATANTGFNSRTLILGASTATHTVTLTNDLNLSTGQRGVRTGDGAALIDGILSGTITSTSTSGGLTKAGAGTLALSGTNTYSGKTSIDGGTLQVSTLADGSSNSNIGASTNAAGNLVLNSGTLRYTGAAVDTDRLFSLQASSTINASGTGALNFENTGAMDFNGGTAAKTLTLTGTNTGNNTLAASIANNTGATSLSKTGIGTWLLSGVNSATGSTSLSGGGTLVLDYTGGDTSRLPSGVLNLGAGNLTLKGGTASNTQAVASTTITSQSVNTGNTVISRDGGSSKIALGAITRSGSNGNGGTISIAEDNLATTTSSDFNGILSGAITIGSNYVKNDGAGNIVALSGISAGNYANFTAATNTSTENYQLTGTLVRGAAAINSLRIVSDGDDQFLNLGNDVSFQVGLSSAFNATGGILYAGGGNNNYTIKGTGTTTLQMQNGNQEVIINVYTGTLNVETRVGNGTGVFTKTGAGTLVLKGASIYTGRTHVNQGTLLVNNTTGNGIGTGAVTGARGATLGGTGTVGGSTTIAAGGGLTFDLTTASGSHDKLELAATKTLTFSGTSTLTITSSGGTPGTGTYTLLTAPGGITGVAPTTVNLPGGWTAGAATIVGNDLQINITSTGGGGSAYDTWKAANAPGSNPDDDTDGDGVANAVEFVLGGTSATNDLGKLPVTAADGTNMTVTFKRKQSSIDPKTSLAIEVGTDLVIWNTAPSPYTVPDGETAGPPVKVQKGVPTDFDTITLTVAQDSAKKFARLKVVITP